MKDQKPMSLSDVAAYLEQDLEDRRAGGEDCPVCVDGERLTDCEDGYGCWSIVTCPDCKGTGKNQAITQAEAALKAVRVEMERVERLVKRLKWAFGRNYWGSAMLALAEYDDPPVEEKANDD